MADRFIHGRTYQRVGFRRTESRFGFNELMDEALPLGSTIKVSFYDPDTETIKYVYRGYTWHAGDFLDITNWNILLEVEQDGSFALDGQD